MSSFSFLTLLTSPLKAEGGVFRVLLLCLTILPLTPSAFAANETQSRKELQTTISKIKESKARQEKLKTQARQVEKELRPLKDTMVDLAEKMQDQEKILADLVEKIDILETEKTKKLDELKQREKQMQASLESMIKLSRLPPEAVVAMPGNMENTLRAAQVLKIITEQLHAESISLKEQLKELDILETKLTKSRTQRDDERNVLAAKQNELAKKISERTRLQEKLGVDQKKLQADAQILSKKSKSLQDLVANLEKQRVAREKAEAQNQPITSKREEAASAKGLRSFARAKGTIRMPASGKLVTRFGAAKGQNDTSRGIEISARGGTTVIAPFDGEIVFTGPFMDYGRMVILRHSDGYHSLIAGFSRIDSSVGDVVRQGEPIGALSAKSPSAMLYLELRKDSRPIDPTPWIRDL